ncbi:MAG: hypothetical protein ACFFKA_16860, partial [Candidatus Thorarchaeota archaeon]
MGHKFGYYVIKLPLEEVWNRTIAFWAYNNGIVKEEEGVSPNNLIRKLVLNHGVSMTSWGETYIMNFTYNPNDSQTYVSV